MTGFPATRVPGAAGAGPPRLKTNSLRPAGLTRTYRKAECRERPSATVGDGVPISTIKPVPRSLRATSRLIMSGSLALMRDWNRTLPTSARACTR
jgi:hypothetical protein